MSEQVLTTNVGDRRTPWTWKLRQFGKPLSLSGLTVNIFGKKDNGDNWITATATGITIEPTTAFTVDATLDKIKANGHVVENGDELLLTTTGTLPGALATATRYFAIDVEPNAFRVSLERGGFKEDITASAGSGTHSFAVVGSVAYAPQAADVSAKGTFWAWLRVIDGGSLRDTFPSIRDPRNRGYRVEISEPA